jgi:Ca2+-binding EF-hand superfamily protein
VPRSLFLAFAASTLAFGSAAVAQTPAVGGPKPVSRADFIKKLDVGFAAVDTNHDGVWTKAELETAQARSVQQRLQAEFKQLDTNHDGQLSFQEFAAAAHINVNAEQMLQKVDTNHDGKVTADEFRAPQLANFAKIDANHDGVVTPDEVRKAMSGNK